MGLKMKVSDLMLSEPTGKNQRSVTRGIGIGFILYE